MAPFGGGGTLDASLRPGGGVGRGMGSKVDPLQGCVRCYSDAHKGVSALISGLLFWYPDFCRIQKIGRRHSSDIGQF